MQPQLPPLPLPRGSQWGLFYYQYGIAYASRSKGNKRQWFVTSTELRTLRSGLRTEQKSRFAARGAEILKKGFTDVLK